MEEITATLDELEQLTRGIEMTVASLKEAASDYSDEAAHARKSGDKLPSFSGSPSHALADSLVLRLRAASQQIGGVAGELVRFVQ